MESEMDVENVGEAVPTETDTENIREAVPGTINLGKIQGKLDTENIHEIMSKEINMKEVREAASAQYENLTKDQKEAVDDFFKFIDKDGSGSISVDEFMSFLSHNGLQTDKHEWLFDELDKDNNGTLSSKELVTFFYVLSLDKYKDLLNRRISTPVPSRKAKTDSRTTRANGKGYSWNMGELFRVFDKLKSVYDKLGEWVNEKASSLLNESI